MDIIPKFYIFGVPDGFDMLGGTSAEITYFQKFYNGSTENAKFSIHRDAKGNITYTYLRYNLSSCKSRTGSFFGMSLIFNSVYCANPLRLYELFDWVYDTYIVSDKGFITPVNGSKDIQARYEIARFQDKSDYIQHYIEAVLLGNIKKEFSNEFCSIDSTFSNERPNLVVQEPMQSVSNERLLADLRQYNRVAVSPDWLPQTPPHGGSQKDAVQETPTATIAPEVIVSYIDDTKKIQNYIIESLNDIGSAGIDEAKAIYREVAARLKEVKTTPSTDKRVSQIIRDYTTLTEQLQNLIQKIEEGPTPPPQPPTPPIPPTPWWKNPKVIISGAVGLLVMVISIFAIVHHYNKKADETIKETIKTSQEEQIKITAEVRKSIHDKDYKTAIRMVGKIDEPLCAYLYDSIVFCELSDQTASEKFKKYSDIWTKESQKFSTDTSELWKRALDTVANRRWRYIETLVKTAETTKKRTDIDDAKEAIKVGRNTELHDEAKAQFYENRLSNIKHKDSSISPVTTLPKQITQYRVVICKANSTLGKYIANEETFKNDGVVNGTNFVYHLEYFNTASNQWKGLAADKIQTSDDNQFKKKVPAFGIDYYGIKLTDTEGWISISKGDFKCKITIKRK